MTEEFSGGVYFPYKITINGITYIKEEELVNSEKAADAHIEKLEKENEELKEELETLKADNQWFRARLDMLGEKE